LRTTVRRGLEKIEQRNKQQPDHDPKGEILAEIVHAVAFPYLSTATTMSAPPWRFCRHQNIRCIRD
jgi:hypothetical protein